MKTSAPIPLMNTPSTLLVALFSTVIAAQATDRFRLDFDNSVPAPPGNTQSGWEAFSETADANNKSEAYSGYPMALTMSCSSCRQLKLRVV